MHGSCCKRKLMEIGVPGRFGKSWKIIDVDGNKLVEAKELDELLWELLEVYETRGRRWEHIRI